MSKIKLLDCTLRDGGYINSWKFGKKAIEDILFNTKKSGMDIIECGFLTSSEDNPDCSLYSSVEKLGKIIKTGGESMYVAMIAMGERELDPRLLSERKDGPIDGIRLTFHPSDIDRAFVWAKTIMDKGYEVFMQPVGTTNYTDKEFLNLLERINQLNPYAFYIVDTLGVMYRKDLLRQVYLVDNNLNSSIRLGYHSHNNLQLAFSNAQTLCEYKTEREIILDCSANGMGRGAGNLCSELIMDYLNKNNSTSYDVLPILEIVDQYLTPIYLETPWGYSSPYFLSATNCCHPNYSIYLMAKHSLSISAMNSILRQIPPKSRRFFDKSLIEGLYQGYQSNAVDDIEIISELRKTLDGKKILVLAPGASVKNKKDKIVKYIEKNKPYVIAVNFIPDFAKPDLLFIGNSIRYEQLADKINVKKTVFTSNIKGLPKKARVVNYSELINSSYDASDSSGIMALKLLKKASVNSAALAGYDGFTKNPLGNYIENDFCGIYDPVSLQAKNLAIGEQLELLSKKLKLKFITPSIYNKKMNKAKGVKNA